MLLIVSVVLETLQFENVHTALIGWSLLLKGAQLSLCIYVPVPWKISCWSLMVQKPLSQNQRSNTSHDVWKFTVSSPNSTVPLRLFSKPNWSCLVILSKPGNTGTVMLNLATSPEGTRFTGVATRPSLP